MSPTSRRWTSSTLLSASSTSKHCTPTRVRPAGSSWSSVPARAPGCGRRRRRRDLARSRSSGLRAAVTSAWCTPRHRTGSAGSHVAARPRSLALDLAAGTSPTGSSRPAGRSAGVDGRGPRPGRGAMRRAARSVRVGSGPRPRRDRPGRRVGIVALGIGAVGGQRPLPRCEPERAIHAACRRSRAARPGRRTAAPGRCRASSARGSAGSGRSPAGCSRGSSGRSPPSGSRALVASCRARLRQRVGVGVRRRARARRRRRTPATGHPRR